MAPTPRPGLPPSLLHSWIWEGMQGAMGGYGEGGHRLGVLTEPQRELVEALQLGDEGADGAPCPLLQPQVPGVLDGLCGGKSTSGCPKPWRVGGWVGSGHWGCTHLSDLLPGARVGLQLGQDGLCLLQHGVHLVPHCRLGLRRLRICRAVPRERNPEGSERGPGRREPELGCQHPVPQLSRQPAALPGGFLPLVRLAQAQAKPQRRGQVGVSPGCPVTVVLLTGVPEQPPAPGWPQRAAKCPGEEVRSDSPQSWVCPPSPGRPPDSEGGGWMSGMGAMQWVTGTRTQNGVNMELRISTKQKRKIKIPSHFQSQGKN